ncbi:head GIN domain-containing protein [Pontibacter sp. SGAir0037]|uniref:head GIN domain-containing protein n=1 Tax=Pontibacter sp. SGAir0037 TaxID=2571030 RepID=UPI0010CD04FD|nr:head GIN domain-containing protein [Pontibacter sp. SGAir0037]QCR24022.1 DUF2807 domain-containing protein [Pontibacter sp. SGAir0037]
MKIMKSYPATAFVLAFAFLLLNVPAFAQSLRGNGNIQAQNRNVSGFKGINVSGGFAVEITQGNSESLRIEAEENLLGNIVTEVKGGVLHIYNEGSISTNKGMKAYITIRELNSIDISGGVKVTGNSTFKTKAMKFDMSGASKVKLALDADRLNADMSGASKVELSGRASEVSWSMSGASNVSAEELESKVVKVTASGASKIRVNATEKLDINASGASNIAYKGKPSITSDVSGGTKISSL